MTDARDRMILISVNLAGCRVPGTGPMLQNPLTDTINALTDTGFSKPAFWLLLLGCAIAAKLVWRSQPSQRSIRAAGRCHSVSLGTMLTQIVFSEINSAAGRDSTT